MRKRMVSLLLCVVMLAGILPVQAAAGITALPTPTGLEWGQYYTRENDPTDSPIYNEDSPLPGMCTWDASNLSQVSNATTNTTINIGLWIYKKNPSGDDELVYGMPFHEVDLQLENLLTLGHQDWYYIGYLLNRDWVGFESENLESYHLDSGDYYFEVQYTYDGDLDNSDLAKSDIWSYIKPSEKFAAPSGFKWNGSVLSWTPPKTEDVAIYAYIVAYYKDGQPYYGTLISGKETSVDVGNDDGVSVRLMALSGDMTKIQDSDWSEMSPAYQSGQTAARSASLSGVISGEGHRAINASIDLDLTGDSFDLSQINGYDAENGTLPAGTDLTNYLLLDTPADGEFYLVNEKSLTQNDRMMAVRIQGRGCTPYHGQVTMTISGKILASGKNLSVTPSDDCVWNISPEPSTPTPPPEDESYALWFFGTKVTEANKADILGKGKGEASFDPKTNTLTLRANGNSFGTAGTTPMLKSELDHLTLRIESSITMRKQDGIAIEAKNLTIQIANPSASLTVIGKPAAFSQAPLNVPEEIFAGANEASAQRESTWAFDPTTTPYVRLGMHQWQWYWETLFDRGHWFGCKHAGCYAVENVGVHVLEWYPDEEPFGANPGKQHQECKICGYKGPSASLPGTAPGITTDSLLDSEIGMAYKDTIKVTGTVPFKWSITSGKLPDGLTMNSETGEITGKPKKAGTFTFTVQVTNQVPGASAARRNYTIKIDEASNNLRFVKRVTKDALKNADADSRENIENAIYNLIFKAQFRPTGINKNRKFANTEKAIFTGSVDVNKNFTIQNIDQANKTQKYKDKIIKDSVFGPIKLQHGCGGCMAYAQFCEQYTYGRTGKAQKFNKFSDKRSVEKVKEFIRKWADPGEEIRLFGHSIVFLGERDDGKGIYCISYGGGKNVSKTNHSLLLEYRSYDSLKNSINYVDDTNGGSYFEGTAKTWKKVRETQKASKTIIRINCPVEASVTLNGFILDSGYGPFERPFGTVERVDDGIVFTLDYSEDYVLDIRGTGEGTMDAEIEYLDEAGNSLGSQEFDGMPIAPDTVITSGAMTPESVVVLYYIDDGEYVSAWGANLGETATEASDELLSTNNTPDTENEDVEDDTPSPDCDGHTPSKMISIGNAANGSITVSPETASKGETVTLTVAPDKGYTLETLTVTDKSGNEIALTHKGDGKYTFKMPGSKVTVKATFMEDNSMLNFFVDVFPGDYYYDAVLWAAENGITGGVDDTHFAPNAPCTRAQIVTFLWRAADSPVVNDPMNFSDVPADAYCAEAVRWAVSQGITTGTSDTTFSPDATCTRAQAMTFLYRSEQAQGGGMQGAWMFQNPFADVDLESYYGEAVMWAVSNGVTNGTSDTTFSPGADCTRAQIVTFLYRFFVK